MIIIKNFPAGVVFCVKMSNLYINSNICDRDAIINRLNTLNYKVDNHESSNVCEIQF